MLVYILVDVLLIHVDSCVFLLDFVADMLELF